MSRATEAHPAFLARLCNDDVKEGLSKEDPQPREASRATVSARIRDKPPDTNTANDSRAKQLAPLKAPIANARAANAELSHEISAIIVSDDDEEESASERSECRLDAESANAVPCTRTRQIPLPEPGHVNDNSRMI